MGRTVTLTLVALVALVAAAYAADVADPCSAVPAGGCEPCMETKGYCFFSFMSLKCVHMTKLSDEEKMFAVINYGLANPGAYALPTRDEAHTAKNICIGGKAVMKKFGALFAEGASDEQVNTLRAKLKTFTTAKNGSGKIECGFRGVFLFGAQSANRDILAKCHHWVERSNALRARNAAAAAGAGAGAVDAVPAAVGVEPANAAAVVEAFDDDSESTPQKGGLLGAIAAKAGHLRHAQVDTKPTSPSLSGIEKSLENIISVSNVQDNDDWMDEVEGVDAAEWAIEEDASETPATSAKAEIAQELEAPVVQRREASPARQLSPAEIAARDASNAEAQRSLQAALNRRSAVMGDDSDAEDDGDW